MLDRDLKLIIVPHNSAPIIDGKKTVVSSSSFFEKFNAHEDEFTFILVGKDGSVKLRRVGEVVSSQELFQLIDSMPMRKAEMATGN